MGKKIIIIGCGGIGSFLCKELNRLLLKDQIDIAEVSLTIADDDVVEMKNIRYQNFQIKDVLKQKSRVLSERYMFNYIDQKIENNEQLQGYDLIVIAVDNANTRKLVFDYYSSNKNSSFIDLRSTGRSVAFFTNDCCRKKLIESLGKQDKTVSHSCQLDSDLNKGIIQNGNIIIASIGSQLVLNWLRGENNPPELIIRI